MGELIDIGGGVQIRYWRWRDDEEPGGIIERHSRPDGTTCDGAVTFDTPSSREKRPAGPFWTVVQREPLTLSPSIRCRTCGHHGWIRDGAWESAG